MEHKDYFKQSNFGNLTLFELVQLLAKYFCEDHDLSRAESIEVFTLIAVSLFGGTGDLDGLSGGSPLWNETLEKLEDAKIKAANEE